MPILGGVAIAGGVLVGILLLPTDALDRVALVGGMAIMVVLGVAMIAITLSRGGGPTAVGILFGVLFILAGGGRLWVQRRR